MDNKEWSEGIDKIADIAEKLIREDVANPSGPAPTIESSTCALLHGFALRLGRKLDLNRPQITSNLDIVKLSIFFDGYMNAKQQSVMDNLLRR